MVLRRLLCAASLAFLTSTAFAEEAIVALGDSLTESAGASTSANKFPSVTASALGVEVINAGVGGQTSEQIAARQGAEDITVRLGDSTPLGYEVKSVRPNILYRSGSTQGAAGGSVDGHPARLHVEAGAIYLDTFGTPAPRSVQFIPDTASEFYGRSTIIWAGRNNTADRATVVRNIADMVERTNGAPFLVLGVLTADTDPSSAVNGIKALNRWLRRMYGERFIDVQSYLNLHGDGSAADMRDIRRGVTPSSLRFDNIHLNDAGYRLVGELVATCWVSLSACPANK